LCDNRSSRAVGLKISLVWFVSVLVTSPLIVIGFVRPEEIMSQEDLQCSITNRPFLVYGSLTAYFFPLGVMLVAYTASIRLLGRQDAAGTRLRRADAPWNGSELRRSRSGRHQMSATHSGARTPEVIAGRFRRDGCGAGSTAGSVRSLHAAMDDQQRQQDRAALAPLLWGEDGHQRPDRTSTLPGTSCRNVVIDRPLADSCDACRRDADVQFDRSTSSRHSCNEVGPEVTAPDDVNACVRELLPVGSESRDAVPTATVDAESVAVNADSPHSPANSRRFVSLVQKHAAAIRASGSEDPRQQRRCQVVATAAAAAAAIRTVRTERKAARVIGAVFAVFVTCWTPFFVLNLSLGVCGPACRQAVVGIGGLYSVFLWLGYVASTLNPIVYTAFNGTFRRTFADLITCRRRPCTRHPTYAAPRTALRRQDSTV